MVTMKIINGPAGKTYRLFKDGIFEFETTNKIEAEEYYEQLLNGAPIDPKKKARKSNKPAQSLLYS